MTIKRSISLPKDQDARIQAIARRRRAPYSSVVQAALRVLLELDDRGELERAYREYYSEPEHAAKVSDIVAEYRALAQKAWP